MKILENITKAVGNTPLVDLGRVAKGCKARLVVKLEKQNPGGSVKDRVALNMIEVAEKEGLVHCGTTIIEPTSGNTGVGLAMVCASRGYRLILVMPDTMTLERRNLLALLGAQIELTPGKLGMKGAIERAKEIYKEQVAKGNSAFIPSQFDNGANPAIHEATTGMEIWNDTDGEVDIFVAGVGTGGTVSGCATLLKRLNPNVKAVAVEPATSPVIAGGTAGPHKIQGIGAGFIPSNLNVEILDEVIGVADDAAKEMALRLAREEGLMVGISSGAAVCAGLEVANREENEGKLVVVLLPDTGERYLSVLV